MNYLLAFLAWVGHLILLVGCHNWLTGHPLNKRAAQAIHLLHLIAFLLFPVSLLAIFGVDLHHMLDWSVPCPGQRMMSGYVLVCLLVVLLWFPLLTLARRRYREAIQDLRVHRIDFAAHLGKASIGEGSRRGLASLPGNQIFQVEFVEKTLTLPQLPPAWDGLKLLHLSDLHFHGTPSRSFFRAVIERCADWEPDLVVITGDIVDSSRHHGWILPILGRLRWKAASIAILGNHDHRHDVTVIRRRLRRLGMIVLENNWMQLEVRGQSLVVIGHEGPWLKGTPDLSGCPQPAFRLCLSHTPDHIDWAREQRVDLMLAGHVHGGQIRLPIVGSVFVPSKLGRRYDAGTYWLDPTLLHVSRGLSGEFPVRYNCRPEATLLILQRASSG